MRTAKEIRRYLKQQHWYKEYVRNVKPRWSKRNIARYIKGYEGYCTIGGAFFWKKTIQGHRTWMRREELFTNWYNRGKERYESKKVSGKPA